MSIEFETKMSELEDRSIDPDEVQSAGGALTIIERQSLIDGIVERALLGEPLSILTP